MILDIPDPQSFKASSISLLNLAWEIAIGLVTNFDEMMDNYVFLSEDSTTKAGEDLADEQIDSIEDNFWERSQFALGNAIALIQQSIEMALKGRIAEVSPFLLIIRDARDYPSGSDRKDISFSSFRSIDASDLRRIHDTVCKTRLDPEFVRLWGHIRAQRNLFVHAVNRQGGYIRASGIIDYVLLTNIDMHPETGWMAKRLAHRKNHYHEKANLSNPEYDYGLVLGEFEQVLNNVQTSIARFGFKFDRRQRRYLCPRCLSRADRDAQWEEHEWRFAQLRPKSSTAKILFCTFCQEDIPVLRISCGVEGCKSNVISDDDGSRGLCLICEHDNESRLPVIA